MSDFRKKMAEFCRKRAKNTAFSRDFTLKWLFFALKSDFRKIFAEKSVRAT